MSGAGRSTIGSTDLVRVAVVGSALDSIHQLASEGASHGTAVVAEEQLAGRGARGRPWHSPRGGLWLAVLYRRADALGAEVLSLRVALEAADELSRLAGVPPIMIKWPNDLIVQDRKLGGILCEARWQGARLAWIAIGLGINVTNPVPDQVRQTATTLGRYACGLQAGALAPILAARLGRLNGGPSLTPEELAAFDRRDWLRGRTLREPAVGVARGIAADGTLRLEQAGGRIVSLRSGHIVLAAEEE
jgi:BirA family biotin operon repressor/biotin-[acetyl-CoA-carboxylase] ligase